MSEVFKNLILIITVFDLMIIFWAGVEQVIYEIKKFIKKKKENTTEEDLDELEDFEFEMIPEVSVDVIRNMYSGDIEDFVKKRICQRKEFEKLSDEERKGAVLLLSSYIAFLQEEAPVDEQNFPMLLHMLNNSQVMEDYEAMDAVEMMLKESSVDRNLNEKYYFNYLKYKTETPNRSLILAKCRVAIYGINEKLYGEHQTKYYVWNGNTEKNIKEQLESVEVEY